MKTLSVLVIFWLGNAMGKVSDIPPVIEKLIDDSLLSWEAPDYLKNNFTYYHSGFDEEKPIWAVEFGHWNTIPFVEKQGKELEFFEKYVAQFLGRIAKSVVLSNEDGVYTPNVMSIIDLEDMPIELMTSPRNVQFLLRIFGQYIRNGVLPNIMEKGFVINANFVAESIVRLIRPVLGTFFDRLEIYGTNKERWLPVIVRNFPRDQIPSWYGGTNKTAFKPVNVYG